MLKCQLMTIIVVSLLSAASLADDAMCPQKSAKQKLNDQQPQTQQCQPIDKPCESKEVGVLNWLSNSHDNPSLHFIDFVEVFLH